MKLTKEEHAEWMKLPTTVMVLERLNELRAMVARATVQAAMSPASTAQELSMAGGQCSGIDMAILNLRETPR